MYEYACMCVIYMYVNSEFVAELDNICVIMFYTCVCTHMHNVKVRTHYSIVFNINILSYNISLSALVCFIQ